MSAAAQVVWRDVYKRQHLDGLEDVTGIKHTHSCVLPPSDGVHGIKNFLTGNIDPVSYTHLDVYKRQAAACSSAGRWRLFA